MKTYKQNETPEFEMIRAAAPEEEGARQYYFIEEAKILWKQQFETMVDSGRPQSATKALCYPNFRQRANTARSTSRHLDVR